MLRSRIAASRSMRATYLRLVAALPFETAASPPPQGEGGGGGTPFARLAGTRECRDGAPGHALGGDRARCCDIPIHNVKQRSLLRSRRAFSRPGSAVLCSIRPTRGERSAERRKLSVVALVTRDRP